MTSTSAPSRKVRPLSFFKLRGITYLSPSARTLSKIACNRLQKELVEWQSSPPAGFKHKPTDNLQRSVARPFGLGFAGNHAPVLPLWIIEVVGAPGTLYAGETYQLQVDFPEHYPMEAPQVIFLHPVPLHQHIYSNGHICLGQTSLVVSHDPAWKPHPLSDAGKVHAHSQNVVLDRFLLMHGCPEKLVAIRYILYDSWSPAMTVSSVCISILSMLSSSTAKQRPPDNDRYVKNCRNGRSPKETRWWFHDDKSGNAVNLQTWSQAESRDLH
ncbi:hypothetical protein Taro_042362 [Colocasia esculenta]|uniref:UBC core domain-containing protein n=1 Tax=Colocasia esculenta TaxID=4460 RepID=A0A843WSL4_COLES|nr:hypothetical protein [Colocasia esculenta]